MKVKETPFSKVERDYYITSGELRKALGLEGEITHVILYRGRSPNDEEKGVSADKDVWEIHTEEIHKHKTESREL